MSSSQPYESPFFTIPRRITNLPGITIAFLRFYEVIFQFWHHGEQCFLSNQKIKERTGILSASTIQEAFEFFEKHGEIKRIWRNGRRFIEQPNRSIEVEHEASTLSLERDTPSRQGETPPLATARHNKNNINNINNNTLSKRTCPLDFTPNEKHYRLGEELGVNVDEQVPIFIDYFLSEGTKYLDWDRTFNNWIRREHKFNKNGKKSYDNRRKSKSENFNLMCKKAYNGTLSL